MTNINNIHASQTTASTAPLTQRKYIKQEPYINDEGIWIPATEYVAEGYASTYRCLITKEFFVEAFNKWIG